MKKLLVVLSVVYLMATTHCWGQLNTASISGQVTDMQGANIPGAQVTVRHTATGLTMPVITNESGFYSVQNLPIGAYTVTVTASGFEKYVQSNVTLITAQSLELDVKLTVGAVSETVEVTGAPPLVETRTSDFTQFIESKTISDAPLGSRRTMNVVQSIGGAVFMNDNPGAAQPNYSLAGGRVQSQMTFLDGSLTQNSRLAAGQQSIDPPIDAISEIQVIASTYPAQYGASNGGIVIEASRSGGDRVHASAYEFLRNTAADAPGYFAPFASGTSGPKITPVNIYNVFGGTIGGPIRRDKTFFFFSTEFVRWASGASKTLTVPSQQERSGNFSQLLTKTALGVNPCDGSTIYQGQIFDPTTQRVVNGQTCRTAYPGNIISTPDSVGAKIMSYFPIPAGTATGNTVTGNQTSHTNTGFYFIKIDHELTQKDHLTARYMFYQNSVSQTTLYGAAGADPSAIPNGSTMMIYGSETHTFSANKLNNIDFTFYHRLAAQFSYAYNQNWPQQLGLTGVPQSSFPAINITGFAAEGDVTQSPGPVLRQEQFMDDFSWLTGRHTLKIGGEFRGSHNTGQGTYAGFSSGTFSFVSQTTSEGTGATATTGNPLASLLAGAPGGPSAFSIANPLDIDRRSQYLASYIQDDWAATPRLMLNIGLRWETDFPMTDGLNRLNGFDATQINPVSNTPGVVKFAGVNYPNSAWDGNWTNYSPRLGFAYKVTSNGSTAIRGGWGIFFGPPVDNTTWGQATLGYGSSASIASNDTIATQPFYLRNGVPSYNATSPTLNDSYGAAAAPYAAATTAVSYFPRHRPTERNDQFNLNLEQTLTPNLVMTITGLGNLGHDLTSINQQIDQINPSTLASLAANHTTTGLQQYRPFPQYNGVTLIAPSIGTTNYFAGVVRVEKRYSHGYNFVATYTWSKFLGDVNDTSNAADIGNVNGVFSDYYNRAADYGPVADDVRNRITFTGLYELPFGPGKKWARTGPGAAILGGWELSTISAFQSGSPMTVITGTNNTNAFSSGSQRPNVTGNPNLPRAQRSYQYPNAGTGTWFNTSVFSQPGAYTFGNERNGLVTGPGYTDVDLTLLKRVTLPRETDLEFRVDAFNALNTTELGLPNLTLGSPTFGQITSPNTLAFQAHRTMELGARFSF